MKNYLKLFIVAVIASLGFVACDNEETSALTPTLEVTAVDATSSSIKFIVDAEAERCAYMLYDGDAISADKVLAEGTMCESGIVTINNLKADTKYYVAVAAANGKNTVIKILTMQTEAADDGGGNGDDPIGGEDSIVITHTKDGRWYESNNYYVTFVRDNGDLILLDFYTIDETYGNYLPYGQYLLDSSFAPYTVHNESSRYIPAEDADNYDAEGYYFTDGFVSVDVANGYYSIYMMLTYDENGTERSIQAQYNGLMSAAAVPDGDDDGAKKLIEVLDVGSTYFKFKINAEEGEYWRCSIVDKRTYDQVVSNPGAWIVTYGFMLEGPLTFNWEDGKQCEHVPGLTMSVTSSTDYIIMAALMDYSGGAENQLLGGVEIVEVRTLTESAGSGTVDVNIKEIGANDVTFDCTLGENVWCCYIAMMETANLDEIKAGKYLQVGYESFEECMLSLIPGLSYDFMRQFLESQVDYKWDYLKYGTSYTICIKVVDMDNGVSYIELEPFTTK